MRRSVTLLTLGLGAAVALSTVPAAAHADDAPAPEPIESVEPAPGNTTVLPLFGTTLAVSLVSDGAGTLTEVNLTENAGYTATMVKPNRVAFVNVDGTATVVVKDRPGGGQRVEARAGTLADVTGPGSWSGVVFEGVAPVSVTFMIGGDETGPDITGLVVDAPAGVSAEIGGVRREVEGDEAQAGVRIRFSDGTLTRELRIRVSVGSDDGTPEAKVTIGLGRLRELSNGQGGKPAEPGEQRGDQRGERPAPPAVNTPVAPETSEPRGDRGKGNGPGRQETRTPDSTTPDSTTPDSTTPDTTGDTPESD